MPEKKPLEWSPRAQRNIESIRDYIAVDNPVAAQSVLGEIRRVAESLRNFPMMGKGLGRGSWCYRNILTP